MTPRIRVAALVRWENRVLLCRQEKPGKEYWLLPGGGVDGGETLFADHVVMAVPAHVAATTLRPFGERLTSLLSAMPYVSTAIVAMAFKRAEVTHPLDGTGVLRRRRPRQRQIGCVAVDDVAAGIGDREAIEGVIGNRAHDRIIRDAVGETDDAGRTREQVEQPDHRQQRQ